jgi:hypothetical protein
MNFGAGNEIDYPLCARESRDAMVALYQAAY